MNNLRLDAAYAALFRTWENEIFVSVWDGAAGLQQHPIHVKVISANEFEERYKDKEQCEHTKKSQKR